jgi:hypothetical protein
MSDRHAARLLAGLSPLFPGIQTVIADAGHESRKLARELLRDNGWKLQIVKRRRGEDFCVAWAQSAPKQRLRVCGADFGNDDRYCGHSADAESAHKGMNFSNKL